jgi:hypothetical protein
MELEFDKEIDALLRRAERASPAPGDSHLDADELAAFAENALPDRTRLMYVTHLADCDRCRKMLSSFAATAPAPELAAAAAAFAAAPHAATKATLPWYQRIFRMPNLAYGMATLVVLFSGVIGLLVYQRQMADRNSEVSLATSARPVAVPQSEAEHDLATTTANTSTNSNATTLSSSPIESVTRSGVAVGSSNMSTTSPAIADEKQVTVDGLSPSQPTVSAPAPKPAAESVDLASADKAKREEDMRKDDLAKTENKVLKEDEQRNRSAESLTQMRDMSPNTSSTAKRSSEGPRQLQTQAQNQVNNRQVNELPAAGRNAPLMLSSIKTAGGKKFELRDSIWYDTSYTGQSKKDVKRGTEKYIRLDAGLRNIADQIGGTVVIVWNGQAYKIK